MNSSGDDFNWEKFCGQCLIGGAIFSQVISFPYDFGRHQAEGENKSNPYKVVFAGENSQHTHPKEFSSRIYNHEMSIPGSGSTLTMG